MFPNVSHALPTAEDVRRAEAIARQSLDDATREDESVLAYFLRYGFVTLSAGVVDPIADAAAVLDAAPWVGRQGSSTRDCIGRLLAVGLLEVAPPTRSGYPSVIRLTESPSGNPVTDHWLSEATSAMKTALGERQRYLQNLGFPRSQAALRQQTAALRSVSDGSVLKVMAYHGRTWFQPAGGGTSWIADFSAGHPQVQVRLLLVAENADDVVREGASPAQHAESIRTGMASLRSFARTHPNVRIRRYGRRPDSSLLRCQIVEAAAGQIESCFFTLWRFGLERAVYGVELAVSPETNLAMLANREFDRVFEGGTPVAESLRNWLRYLGRLYGPELAIFGIGPVSLAITALLQGQPLYLLPAVGIAAALAWRGHHHGSW